MFSLFEAPTTAAPDFEPSGTCLGCGAHGPVFTLGIGADLIVPCPSCGMETALEASEASGALCDGCGTRVPFPIVATTPRICARCLHAGKAAFTHDTELGMVRWQDARRGLTHGAPGLHSDQFELVPAEGEPGWMRARVAAAALLELVRTPSYATWQGERWLFCCKQPMVYLGPWRRTELDANAPRGQGATLLAAAVEGVDSETFAAGNEARIHMFRCRTCNRLRGHIDQP